MKRILLSLFLLSFSTWVCAQTTLSGKIIDANSGEAIIFANVGIYKNGVLTGGTESDFDGNFSIANIDPGTYDVEATYVGYQTLKLTGVLVEAGRVNVANMELSTEGLTLNVVEIREFKVPLIKQDETTQGHTVTAEQIRSLPTRNVNSIAATTAGIASQDDGADLNIRGSRSESTNFYVDGIRVTNSNIPSSEIDQLQTITGGVEAQYGDVTGGIISIITKGPSSKYSGGIEMETSEYLDDFGHNLISANASGPIIRNKKGASLLGFRLAAQYTSDQEDTPPGIPIYQVKEEFRQELIENPLTRLGNVLVPTAETYTNEQVEALSARDFEKETSLNLTARLDARVTDDIDLSFTGAYFSSDDQFTPYTSGVTNGVPFSGGYSLDGFTQTGFSVFNSHNNPTNKLRQYRGNVRFRHRIGGSKGNLTEEEKKSRKSAIVQNLSYTLQFAYENSKRNLADPRHGDNYFDYGHVGNFDFNWTPVFPQATLDDFDDITQTFTIANEDFRQNFIEYTPGDINPGLANYNKLIDRGDINSFITRNGNLNSTFTGVYDFHTNVNMVYNRAFERDNDLYTFTANSSFDIVPNGSDQGRHNIQFGIIYEQRFERFWSLAPNRLWEIGRQLANRHINGINMDELLSSTSTQFNFNGIQSTLIANTFAAAVDPGSSLSDPVFFWQNVRNATGAGVDEFVNIESLNPDQLSLGMFSPIELTDNIGLIDFQGYDYEGNKLSNNITFDDFWTGDFADGTAQFLVAPDKPIYSAAYIQDKFYFKDIIFRLGLRVERFDANSNVLKDPFSFYEVMGAGTFHSTESNVEKPAAIGDDFKVYTASETSNQVVAYRNNDIWFLPDGTQANSGALIFGGEVVNPKLVDPDITVRSRDFDPSSTFEDYEPQVNWLPRLSFSFPISDVANFFAHYDVLVQRPSNNNVSALDYFYFTEPGRITTTVPINNANLRPQKTVDYAVGFQQKLSNSSAVKLTAYYRELRDMIQRQTILFVPPPLGSYETYGNQDFGTVKGFTFQYDLRRTGNLTMRLDYTLQFADGTGSGADSQRGLSQRGNLRTLFPLNFDERHRISATLDFRYGNGRFYTGPKILGVDILSNTGANLLLSTWSGRPYTSTAQPQLFGGSGNEGTINGSRLPWSSRIDLRIDKSFRLGKSGASFAPNFNVYLRIQNLLDQENTLAVYSATGSSNDSGFLNSTLGQATTTNLEATGRPLQPYLDAYAWALLNPDFYSLPRRIILGAIIDF